MRIITHTDFDGLISAYLICKELGIKNPEVITAEPGEVQKGYIKFQRDDIVCDLPQPRDNKLNPVKVKLWFDHHLNSSIGLKQEGKYIAGAKSCAQVIYDYFKMDNEKEMLEQVNRIDSADFTLETFDNEDTGYFLSWALRTRDEDMDLHFFKYVLKRLIDYGYKNVMDEVIKFRASFKVDKMKESRKRIKKILQVKKDIGILDMRAEEGSKFFDKFYPFVLKPKIKYCIRLQRGPGQIVRISISRNIFDKSKTDISVQEIAKMFGGGGHKNAGGFDSTFDECDGDTERVIQELQDGIDEEKK